MTGHGFQIEGIVGVIAERRPDLLDAFVHSLFKIDECVAAPELLLDFIASDELPGAAGEHRQKLERLRRKLQQCAIFTQFFEIEIQLEDPET